MGVMCSLLGHDYGDADVERERAEQGDEVVRTAKRVERCHNCGHARTISENTEVTALSAAAGVVREPDGTVVAATDGRTETISEASSDDRESGGGIAIESVAGTESALAPASNENEQADIDESADEIEDDATDIDRIHNDEPETRDRPSRAPGEWPTERDDKPAHAPNAETPRRESSGLSSSGSLATEKPRVGRWPGETDAAEARPASAEFRNATRNGAENGPEPTTRAGESARPVAGDSFVCSSCGFNAAVADSSLRAGDICPGCGHGYLACETRKG